MTRKDAAVAHDPSRVTTGVRNLDALFDGGLPRRSVTVVCGPPGSGKTILAQQMCFHAASSGGRAVYFNTLSEPLAKTLRYLKPFAFFDAGQLPRRVEFVDLGIVLQGDGLHDSAALIVDRVKKRQPRLVVIDSFKAFDNLTRSKEEQRKFGYELAVNLMALDVTALLLGEYGPADYMVNPLFSVIDGLLVLSQRESSGEQQRFIQIVKMRGADQSRDEHPFAITSHGIDVYAPRVAIVREPQAPGKRAPRCKTGIDRFDDLLGDGIPRGSSVLVAGAAGTGKTVLSLEFVYRGALADEKGLLFSFEETTERLLANARGLGWDLEREIARGMLDLVFIPQPEIVVERDLLMMREKVESFGAKRVAIDSISVFLHKVRDAQIVREKVFQIASIVHNAGAVGFLATDVPYGSAQLSRHGVEETVVDGVVLLTSTEEGSDRQRYVEVYKLRNTAHLKGRHSMVIEGGGIRVFPRYADEVVSAPPALRIGERLPSGVPGLDAHVGGGLLVRSATLVAGSAGIGKTTMGLQFVLEGARRGEPGIVFTLEEGPEQLLASAAALELPLQQAVRDGVVELVYLSRPTVRAIQLLAVLGDRVRDRKARRVVLDSVTHLARDAGPFEELWQMLYKLVQSLKALDVTSVLTLETTSLHSSDEATESGFSPLADNILALRYAVTPRGELHPVVTVVKTRGSVHDSGTYRVRVEAGGLRLVSAIPRRPPRTP